MKTREDSAWWRAYGTAVRKQTTSSMPYNHNIPEAEAQSELRLMRRRGRKTPPRLAARIRAFRSGTRETHGATTTYTVQLRVPAGILYSTIACITAFSKSRWTEATCV